jgi:non-specific serine/threonine protein kinase/serine/threonine-protein kinase
MTPENWARITDLFGEALELTEEERETFLQRVRREDPVIGMELASLLEQHGQPGEFLPALPLPAPALDDLSGRSIGAYRLIRLLGSGGMGAVYLAERADGAFSKKVAIKLLSAPFLHALDRLRQEREILGRLDHPNIARLLDGGATPEGLPYLVMEYVDGAPIDRYSKDRGVSLEERIGLLLQVCAGVEHAHRNLIIHRDLKPENILVTAGGTVKLVDFGIAKLLDDALNVTFQRPATPAFSSPEQLRGEPVTTASDVYALGVLGYVLLTGSHPYALRSGRLDELLQAVLTAEPMRPSLVPGLGPQTARKLRGDLDNILLRAIARERDRRFPSVEQFAEDLERYRNGFPVRARPDTLGYRARKFVGRYRIASAFATLALLFLLGGIAVTAWQAQVAQRRFEDLRQFAHSVVFDISDSLSSIPGTIAVQKQVVETALRYLDRLSQRGVEDVALREELAGAYVRIGKVQGGAFEANLGDSRGALDSFNKAIAAIGPAPTTPRLRRLLIEAHIQIADLSVDPAQALPEFRAVLEAGEKQLAGHPDDIDTLRLMADACNAVATIGHLSDRVDGEEQQSVRERDYRRRVLDLAPGSWRDQLNFSNAVTQYALAMQQKGDYPRSLAELQRSSAMLETGLQRNPGNELLIRALAEKHSRAGAVYRLLGRLDESESELQKALALFEPIVMADPHNSQYRGDLAYTWFRLAETLRMKGESRQALELHQKALTVRRERAALDTKWPFVRWDLTQSLNAVADIFLTSSPPRVREAGALFEEARRIAEETLRIAPSFNELRKQLAKSQEGLGRVALASSSKPTAAVRQLLEESLHTWQEVQARASEDRQDADQASRVQGVLAALPAVP